MFAKLLVTFKKKVKLEILKLLSLSYLIRFLWSESWSFLIRTPPPNPNCRIRPRVLIPNEESEIEFCRLDDVHDADEVNGDQGGDSTFILEGNDDLQYYLCRSSFYWCLKL